MGNKIELFRMSIYVFFPVALFYYFNRPKWYEKWIEDKRVKVFGPEGNEKKLPDTLGGMKKLRQEIISERKGPKNDS